MKIFRMRQVIGAGACDPSGRLSLVGALTLIEDAVTDTMAKLKIDGFTVRRKYGALIVFSKNHLRFLQTIGWQDKVVVSCFVSAKSAARMNIDVCVKKAGKIAMHARTEVCAVDAQTGRIRRMESVGVGKQVKIMKAPYDLPWNSMEGEGELIDNVTVRTGNIDYAGHTNNVEYIRLLLNTLTLDEWRGMTVQDLQVAYLNQSFLNDNLSIYCADQPTDDAKHERIYTIKKAEQDILRCSLQYRLVVKA
ncbi:MAG: thioesterase [Clostridia bacterium]|nr:thioesterase [Clostridia bacterium]